AEINWDLLCSVSAPATSHSFLSRAGNQKIALILEPRLKSSNRVIQFLLILLAATDPIVFIALNGSRPKHQGTSKDLCQRRRWLPFEHPRLCFHSSAHFSSSPPFLNTLHTVPWTRKS